MIFLFPCIFAVAKQFESLGKFQEAEQQYTLAGDWLRTVNMYRNQGCWMDAVRVAKSFGGDDATKRVAYAYALHLGIENAASTLDSLGLLDDAIDFAAGSENFAHAFTLVDHSSEGKRCDIQMKYAMHLENLGKYKEAEAAYVDAIKPKEAIDMYVHLEMWNDALRVAKNYDPSLVSEVHNMKAAVIGNEVPASLDSTLVDDYSDYGDMRGTIGQSLLMKAKKHEQSRNYDEALDCYLRSNGDNLNRETEELLKHALRVAKTFCPARYDEVVRVIEYRFKKDSNIAVDLLFDSGDIDAAVEVALSGKCWDKAREYSRRRNDLSERVETCYKEYMAGKREYFYDGNEPNSLINTTIEKSKGLIARGLAEVHEAILLLLKLNHDVPDFNEDFSLYNDMVVKVLSMSTSEEEELGKTRQKQIIDDLKTLLYNAWNEHGTRGADSMVSKFKNILMATQYTSMLHCCLEYGLIETAQKCAISLLGYCDALPSDKAYLIAGELCRECGTNDLAFLLLSHYVDLIEAIDEGDMTDIENTDIEGVDLIVPPKSAIPDHHYVTSEARREEVRDWVLSMCMKLADKSLSSASNAIGSIHEGLYHYRENGIPVARCIITGFPVFVQERLPGHGFVANRKDWFALVRKSKKCPWSGSDNTEQLLL